MTTPELDDRNAEAQHGLGEFIQAKLGKEAAEVYYAVINATVADMANPQDVITDERVKLEITEAWRDLGKARDWLKAEATR